MKGFRKRDVRTCHPVYLAPGDSVQVTYWPPEDEVNGVVPDDKKIVHTELVGRALRVDTIATYDVINDLGFKDGIMIILGEAG